MSQEPILRFTTKAIEHINKSLIKFPDGGFRLSIKKTGCSGYQYLPEIMPAPRPGDVEFTAEQGLRVFVDSKFVKAIQGTVVDLVKKSLGQQQLVFSNPNTDGECGCGESVHFSEDPNGQ